MKLKVKEIEFEIVHAHYSPESDQIRLDLRQKDWFHGQKLSEIWIDRDKLEYELKDYDYTLGEYAFRDLIAEEIEKQLKKIEKERKEELEIQRELDKRKERAERLISRIKEWI